MPVYDEWRQIVSDIVPLKDFKAQRLIRLGYFGTLPKVLSGGTYQVLASPAEEEGTYEPEKYGALAEWTWEQAINDDLKALQKIPKKLALSAKATVYRAVFDLIATNAKTPYDNVDLFHANHGNLRTNALSSDELTQAKIAMRSQTALDSDVHYLSIKPRFMLVPVELEATAKQLRNSEVEVTTNKDATVANPHFETFDIIVVDYWTDPNNWYLVADPRLIPTIEVGFLGGREVPEMFTENPGAGSSFYADKVVFKIRYVFGVSIVDHRGFHGNIVP